MRRVFIFAIGGTGARVLRSLSMLLAAGIKGMDSDLELVPIIIDYDVVNGDKSIATDCLENYCSIHKDIIREFKDDSFFMTGVSKLKDVATPGGQTGVGIASNNFDVYFGPVTTDCTFAEEIQYDLMTGNMDLTHSLLEALYNDLPAKDFNLQENKETELNLNLKKGFKGNPNIGSVVFDSLKVTEEFKHFKNVFDPVNDKVFIISSIFGGTGSSGFPQIVNSIRLGDMPSLVNACIGAVIVLPYFKIHNAGGAIDSNNFNSKTKAALSFYETSKLNKQLNSIYYIGDPLTTQLADNDGGVSQKNNAHIVELLSALSIIDFCIQNNASDEAYEYGLKSNTTTLNLSNICDKCLHSHFDYLTRFAYMVKYYRDVLQGKRRKIASNEAFFAGLRLDNKINGESLKHFENFIDSFEAWLKELGLNAHQFIPYVLDSSQKITKVLSHKPLQENKVFPDVLKDKDFTEYLNKAFSSERSGLTNDREVEVFFKIMRKATSNILEKVNSIKN